MGSIFVFKRGNAITDGFTVLVVLFAMAFASVVAYQLYDDVAVEINDSVTDTTAKQVNTQVYTSMPGTLDAGVLLAVTLLWLAAIGLSFFIDTHPLYFVLVLVLMLFMLIVAGLFSNSFIEYVDENSLGSAFPMTYFFMNNLVEFVLAIVGSISLALYAKTKL